MTFDPFRAFQRPTLLLIGASALSLANIGHAQTLGAVEQRLDRLEKVTRQLQRATDRSSRTPDSRDEVYLQLNRRLDALERTVSSLVSTQEGDHNSLVTAIAQMQRLKGDVEARLDAVEKSSAPALAATEPVKQNSHPLTADDRFKQAMDYAADGGWPQAELAFDTFITSYPSDARVPEARYQLARAFQGQGKSAQAAQIFLDLFEKFPDAPFAVENLFGLGQALAALNPQDKQQVCDVYGEIEARHGPHLSVEQRSRLLDQRLAYKCSA